MDDKKESFLLYSSYNEILNDLSDEEAGILFKTILEYTATGNIKELPLSLKLAFKFIKNQLDMDAKKYNNKCEKARTNGLKGGRPKKEENQKNQTVLEKPNAFLEKHNENDNDNDNENDNDNVFPPISPQGEKTKKIDKFSSPIFSEFLNEYKKVFGNDGYLSSKQRDKVIELYETIPDLKERLPDIMQRLKVLKFPNIDFKPNLAWLLKNDNFYSVASGEYEKEDDMSALFEEARKELENANT